MFSAFVRLLITLVVYFLLYGILQIFLRRKRSGQEKNNCSDYVEQADMLECLQPTAAKKSDLVLQPFLYSLEKAQWQRVHRDGEQFGHDKGKVYYDSQGDYSYNEELFKEQAGVFCSSRNVVHQEDADKLCLKLKHKVLVQGFIMSQVLDKPRSLRPYGAEELL